MYILVEKFLNPLEFPLQLKQIKLNTALMVNEWCFFIKLYNQNHFLELMKKSLTNRQFFISANWFKSGFKIIQMSFTSLVSFYNLW